MSIDETVYILGAGANQSLEAWDGLRPPLATNFFRVALQAKQFSGRQYTERLQPLYDFVATHFKRDRDRLQREPFDLEELFTTLQLQQAVAYRAGKQERSVQLAQIEFLLKSFLAEYLSQFESHAFSDHTMRELGRVIHTEEATVLSFNYDCIIESVLELASGVRGSIPSTLGSDPTSLQVTEEELAYSHFNWNRPLAYGFKFSELQLQQAGVARYVDGARFYAHPSNALYETPFLKLHGSLNWFRFLPIRRFWMGPAPPELRDLAKRQPDLFGDTPPDLPDSRRDAVILIRGHWWLAQPPDFDGWLIDPVLVTPVLNKERSLAEPLFDMLWTRAELTLSKCRRLVVIGYSFAPTDFHSKDLLRRAFQEGPPDELVVVNPSEDVVTKVLELTHFQQAPTVHDKVEDYIRSMPEPATKAHPPTSTYSPGDRVTLKIGHLEVGGLTLTGSVFRGVTIASRNPDGSYQVRGAISMGGNDELTVPPDWIVPD